MSLKSESRGLVAFFVGTLIVFAPLSLLAEVVDQFGGPQTTSLPVRIATLAPAVLCGVFAMQAYREASAMSKDEAIALAGGARSRWWEVLLAAIVVGSWTYYLLVIAGRVLDGLGLLSFALTSGTVAAFVLVAFAAGITGAAWYARPISTDRN